jgi:hypothetical protein
MASPIACARSSRMASRPTRRLESA